MIVDHFDNYPLVTVKKMDYTLFKECFNIIKDKKHLTHEGLLKIIQIKSSLNRDLSENLKKLFKININEKLKFKFEGIPDPYWVAGFTSGDGSFNIKITKSRLGKVQLSYAINLHIREKDVIVGLLKYLYKYENLKEEITKYIYCTETSVAIQIVKFSDIINVIIPFFDKYYRNDSSLLNHVVYIEHPYMEYGLLGWTKEHHKKIAVAVNRRGDIGGAIGNLLIAP